MNEKKPDYSSIKEYLKFVRENFKPVKTIRTGCFFSQNYFFFLNETYKKYPERKKYLDFFPINLVIYNNPSKKSFVAINWHALPVPTRQILLSKLKKIFTNAFNEDKDMIRLPGINYRKLLTLLKRIGVSVRRYRYERVRKLSIIPPDKIDEVMKYRALTWYQTNYTGMKSRYDKYRPNKK